MQQKFYPAYEVITCLQDVNWLEFDHWVNTHRDLVVERNGGYCHQLEWNLWQDARYPVTNSDHIGRRAVVHTIDPADLGLQSQPDGRNILLYAYEGEELVSALEGNGFCFPGLDQWDSFLHFQGDEVLPSQQGFLGVYFPSFPHETTLIEMETIMVPNRQYDIMGPDPVDVMTWVLSPWYCQHWDVPQTSKWNEAINFMWRTAWHKKNDNYLAILKARAEDPLIERIVELEVDLEEADEIILDLLPSPGSNSCSTPAIFRWSISASSGGGGPPLSELSDLFRDATLGEEAKPEMAPPSPKRARSPDNPQGSVTYMGNPMNGDSGDPRTKFARCLASPGILRRSIHMQRATVPRSAPFEFFK